MDADTKYKALIQPIKDLAQNWDIDIAEELGAYLEQLETLTISVGNGQNLNFAEAALLIQGSTAVYSRKVEYLHQLVLQALELICSQKAEKSGAAGHSIRPKASNSYLDDERILIGTDPTYLLLDDILEDGVNITLDAEKEKQQIKEKRRSSAGRMSLSADTSRASMILMHSILQEDHGGSNLKLSTCRMDASGALLMNGLFGVANGPSGSNNEISNIKNVSFGGLDNSASALGGAGMDIDGGVDDSWRNAGAYDHGDDDDYGHVAGYEPDIASVAHHAQDIVTANTRRNAAIKPVETTVKPMSQPTRNPLRLLDAHEITADSKPARKGKTFRIPATLPPLGGRESSRRNTSAPSSSSAAITPTNVFDAIMQGKIPMTGLSHIHFGAIAKEQRKTLNSNRRARRLASQGEFAPAVEMADSGNYEDHDDDDNDGYFGPTGFYGGDHDADGGVNNIPEFQYGGYDDGFNQNDDLRETGDGMPELDLQEELNEEDILARRVELALSEELVLSQHVTYESLCRKHIDNFMQGAERYARETQLSKRVADWTRKLEPYLKEQEEAVPFDIHDYSHRLIDIVDTVAHVPLERRHSINDIAEGKSDQEIVEFDEVASGKSSTEVCRMFLACLQLANTGNILICPPAQQATDQQVLQHFSVKILQHEIRVEDNIGSYRAPSLAQFDSQESVSTEAVVKSTEMKSKRGRKAGLKASQSNTNESEVAEAVEEFESVDKTQPTKRNMSQRSSRRRGNPLEAM